MANPRSPGRNGWYRRIVRYGARIDKDEPRVFIDVTGVQVACSIDEAVESPSLRSTGASLTRGVSLASQLGPHKQKSAIQIVLDPPNDVLADVQIIGAHLDDEVALVSLDRAIAEKYPRDGDQVLRTIGSNSELVETARTEPRRDGQVATVVVVCEPQFACFRAFDFLRGRRILVAQIAEKFAPLHLPELLDDRARHEQVRTGDGERCQQEVLGWAVRDARLRCAWHLADRCNDFGHFGVAFLGIGGDR